MLIQGNLLATFSAPMSPLFEFSSNILLYIFEFSRAQQEFVKAIFRFFVSEDLSALAMTKETAQHVPFTPLRHDSRVSQQNACVLFSTVIDGCRQQVHITTPFEVVASRNNQLDNMLTLFDHYMSPL
jgi:hypothetical protein